MTTNTLTAELEAINTLLAAISESPVSSLDSLGLADVAAARATLDEVSREVQMIGWHFNTEDAYPLLPNTEGKILLPENTLKAQIKSGLDIAQRGLKLYNRTSHTDTFTSPVEATLVFLLQWDELPQVARHYIMVRASRIFQARNLGSDTQFQFSKDEETDAEKHLTEAEGESGSYNIFSGSSSTASILER